MCRYSISIDDAVMEEVRPHFHNELAVQEWLEQQVRELLTQFVRENIVQHHQPVWTNYKLSPEIETLAPRERKPVYGDYKEQLTSVLEEKYQ